MTKQWALRSTPPMTTRSSPTVALGVARRMGQGHEHLLGLTAMLSYVVLDCGVSAAEPVLILQPLEDALGGVALLPGAP